MLDQFSSVLREHARLTLAKVRPGTPEFIMVITPVIVYWSVALFYGLIDHLALPATERFKVVRRIDKGPRNPISRIYVVGQVIIQHIIQMSLNIAFIFLDPHQCSADGQVPFLTKAARFVLGMYVMDSWQYWIHRWAHTNTKLYRKVHSVHHQLNHVYAYGALYNQPMEALLLDTLGGLLTFVVAGLTCDTATLLFSFATVKTVLDHCGYVFPVNPLHDLFPNSSAFHDVHHDVRYIKKNFSQPFFTHWDWLLGTFVDPAEVHLSKQEVADRVNQKGAAKPLSDAGSGDEQEVQEEQVVQAEESKKSK